MSKPKVLISVPNGDCWTHKTVSAALLRLMQDVRISPTIIHPTHKPYENNLNHIAAEFLEKDYDFWISIDDDNPPTRNPIDLVFLDKPFIGLPTPVWNSGNPNDFPIYWNALKIVRNTDPGHEHEKPVIEDIVGFNPIKGGGGLTECDVHGSGCFVCRRDVIEALKDEQPFVRLYDRQGIVQMGADFYFCLKVKKKGFQIYTHYEYPCDHHVQLSLIEVLGKFRQFR